MEQFQQISVPCVPKTTGPPKAAARREGSASRGLTLLWGKYIPFENI